LPKEQAAYKDENWLLMATLADLDRC